jgi:hypothetical protein
MAKRLNATATERRADRTLLRGPYREREDFHGVAVAPRFCWPKCTDAAER